jgi:NAD(P)-dependent dehydrogenase (short-subunit alcohol dehydrogenase family)
MDERRTVLVTGANSGIGLATVVELGRRGFDAVGSVRSRAKARTVLQTAAEADVSVRTVLLDVTDAVASARVIARLRPWGIVNNAGLPTTGAVEDVDDAEVRRSLETMLVAPMRLARLALPYMREAGGGRIVNVSSIYGLTTTPLTGWYQASKHALEAVSDALRVEVARDRIKVILIEPGGFRTGIWDQAEQDWDRRTGSRYAQAYSRSLQGVRISEYIMGEPEGCARVIAKALKAGRPAQRYLVGVDARAIALYQKLTPGGVRDRLARIALGL